MLKTHISSGASSRLTRRLARTRTNTGCGASGGLTPDPNPDPHRQLRKQQAMLHAAVDARAWCPKNDASGEPVFDRTQKTVQAISHSVKGAAGMVFAQRLAHVSKTLQDTTRVLAAQPPAAEHELEARAAVEVWSLEANLLLEVLESGDATDVVRSNHHHHRRSPKARAT